MPDLDLPLGLRPAYKQTKTTEVISMARYPSASVRPMSTHNHCHFKPCAYPRFNTRQYVECAFRRFLITVARRSPHTDGLIARRGATLKHCKISYSGRLLRYIPRFISARTLATTLNDVIPRGLCIASRPVIFLVAIVVVSHGAADNQQYAAV